MGSIVSRKRKDGTFGVNAQIRLKKDGVVIYTETETFDRKPAAQAWLKKRETELAEPGALVMREDPLLKEVIERYNHEKQKQHAKTKAQVLNTIKAADIGAMHCVFDRQRNLRKNAPFGHSQRLHHVPRQHENSKRWLDFGEFRIQDARL